MRKDQLIAPTVYIRQVVDVLERHNVDGARLLAEHGAPLERLEDDILCLPWETFKQLILDAIRETEEPALGLYVGHRLLFHTHGPLSYAAMNSSYVREVIELVERFIILRTDLVTISSRENSDEFRLIVHETRPLEEVRRPVIEAITLAIKNIIEFITLGDHKLNFASFSFPAPFSSKEEAELAESFYNCELKYNQNWTGFSIPISVLDQRLPFGNARVFQEAIELCERELRALHGHGVLETDIRRFLLNNAGDFPSLEATAARFGMTPRTLHRRLGAEGVSYKMILSDVRHLLAKQHLDSGQLTIDEIAHALGYSDVSNFRRAFKRWESVSPRDYAKKRA